MSDSQTRLEALLEGEKRGILNEENTELLAEARRRGLVEPSRKTSTAGAGATGIAQGLTFGTSDEIAAGVGAAYDYVTGGDKGYDARLKEQRDYIKAAQQENPVAYYGGEIGGSLLIPGGIAGAAARRGIGLGAQMARGAATGAASAAAYGAGTSEGGVENRLLGAKDAAITGGIVGGAAPVAVRGVSNAYNALRDRAGRILSPRLDATRQVADAVAEGTPNPPNMTGLIEDPRMVLDTNNTTRDLARAAANLSGDARDTLQSSVQPRFRAQGERLLRFLRGNNAAGNVDEYRDTLLQNVRRDNRRNYAVSYAEGDRMIMTPEIEALLSSPMVVKAMRNVSRGKGKNRAVRDGFQGFNPGVQVTKDGQIKFRRGESGVAGYPNLQYWDYVKRELDEMASKAFRKGANDDGATAADFARRLRGELDAEVPSFARARGRAAEFFQADNALEAGEQFARRSGDFDVRRVRRLVQDMNPSELEAFREGFASRLVDEIRANPDNRTILNKFMTSDAGREKVEIALGRDGANRMQNFMALEAIMDRSRNAFGNSTTAQQIQQMAATGVGYGLIGSAGAAVSGGNIMSPEFWLTAFAGTVARRRLSARQEQWARQVAHLMTRAANDAPDLERHIRRLSQNRELSEAFQRVAGQAIAAGPGAAIAGERAAAGDE